MLSASRVRLRRIGRAVHADDGGQGPPYEKRRDPPYRGMSRTGLALPATTTLNFEP